MPDQIPSFNQLRHFNFLDLPIGIYLVAPNGHFILCNRPVRLMFGFPLEGPIEASIADFYAEPDLRSVLLQKAIDADRMGRFLEKETIHFRVQEQDLYVENFCRPIKDADTQDVIGYVGCLVDITADYETKRRGNELRQRVEELAFDIGRILHANTTTLVMVMQTLNSMVDTLGPSPFESKVPSPEEVDKVLTENSVALAGAIERFLQVGDAERRLKALPEAKWAMLADQIPALREYKERIPTLELRPSTLHTIARQIGVVCQGITPGSLPRESVREIQQAAWQLERLTSLIDALYTRIAVLQMDYTLHSLREFVTADVRETSKKARVSIKKLIKQIVIRLGEFSSNSNVAIEQYDISDVEVFVNEREVERALANLLHNAIKYTWKRDQTRKSWVSIRTYEKDRKVFVEFENWGVPIAREELEQGLVFNLGYRGKWSSDRGRLGTGIGLTDARRVAQAHGGDIVIESRPTRIYKEDDPEHYKQPFLTTVTFYLPVA